MEKEPKKKTKKLFSDAFPEKLGQKLRPKIHSNIHNKINPKEIDLGKISYRRLQIHDLPEVMNLHREWFPIEYTEQYFKDIIDNKNNSYISIAATYLLNNNEENILGLILAECKEERHYNSQVPEGLRKTSWINNKYKYIYIMTLGVVDECRGIGFAGLLLNKLITEVRKVNSAVLYLHVVDYNTTAIKYYLKNGFIEASLIKNYYHIKDDVYDTKVMVRQLETDSLVKSFYKVFIAIMLFIPFLIKSILCNRKKIS
jgi:ribosomal protein S18 acetylase RimI-like enzyme